MFKKFAALALTLCIMLCMSACELDITSSNTKNPSSKAQMSMKTELNDDIFYDDDEVETSSEVISEILDAVTTTTTSIAPVLDETSTSSKVSSSSKASSSSKTSTSSKKVTTSKVTVTNDETENLVWIPTNGGKKYHSKPSCSNMKNPNQVSRSTAISQGFGPCKRCYK